MHSINRSLLTCLFMACIALVATAVSAQSYPSRPIRVVVPTAPGGSLDVLARIVGQRLSENVNQPVIVDNRAAGGGLVGTDLVAKAPADGHTLLLGSIASMTMAPSLYPKLPYDPINDFAHVGLWVTFPLVLVVQASSPATSLKGFIDLAKAKPGTLSFAAQSMGSSSHIFAERMNSLAGIKVVIVPYKGGAPAMNGLLTGEVDYSMIAVSTALSQVSTGKLRALGVTSAKPVASLPNVPPIASLLPGYEGLNFHGLHAPAKTPAAIVARLHSETTAILRRPDVTKQLTGLAMDIPASTPEQYRTYIQSQITLWGQVIRTAGVRAE